MEFSEAAGNFGPGSFLHLQWYHGTHAALLHSSSLFPYLKTTDLNKKCEYGFKGLRTISLKPTVTSKKALEIGYIKEKDPLAIPAGYVELLLKGMQ